MPALHISRRLAGGLALTAALAGLAAAPPAFAGTASVVNGQLRYVANAGESNDVLIERLTATSYRVTDEVDTMAVGAGCAINSVSRVVVCSPATIASVLVELKDRGDSATLEVTVPTIVKAGTGDDRVDGGSAKDVMVGQGGRDELFGYGGEDELTAAGRLYGGEGGDLLKSDGSVSGINSMYGAAGDDTIKGGGGRDHIVPGLGADDVYGGGSIDGVSYIERATRVVVSLDGGDPEEPTDRDDGTAGEGDFIAHDVENAEGGAANDLLEGNDQANVLYGGIGNDTLGGGAGDDFLGADAYYGGLVYGDAGDDTLRGGDGNDRLAGGPGRDTLNGDTGVAGEDVEGDLDVVTYADRYGTNDGVKVTLDGFRNDGDQDDLDPATAGVQPEGDMVGKDVEGVDGTPGNDTLVGDAQVNQLNGLGGNDTLYGKGGDDRLAGAAGFVAIGDGPPLPPAPGGSAVTDDDKLYGGADEDLLQPGTGRDDLFGGEPGIPDRASLDTVDYSDRSSGVIVKLDDLANDGAPDADGNPGNGAQPENDFVRGDVEGAIGSSARDFLTATLAAQRNVLIGNSGNDLINGGPGDDLLDGGGLRYGYAAPVDSGDEIRGGVGVDTVSYRERSSWVTVTLDDNVANDGEPTENDWVVATGTDAVENVVGGSGYDILKGNAGANTLQGGPGSSADRLEGRDGADYLAGGQGGDTLNGEGGNDRLAARGDRYADELSCGAGTTDVALFDSFDTFTSSPNDCERLNPATAAAAGAAGPVSVAPLVRVERAARAARRAARR